MRILADVNVLVSSAIGPLGMPRSIITAWRQGTLELVISDGIVAQVEMKLRSRRIGGRYSLTEDDIHTAVATLRTRARLTSVPRQSIRPVTGDPEDDYVLATASLGKVDYIVTGDKGLQALGSHDGIPILSPRDFLEILRSEQSEGR